MRLRHALATLALSSTFAVPAFAAVEGGGSTLCSDSFIPFTNGSYVSCQGPLAGSLASLASVSFDGVGSFTRVGLTGDASGAFAGSPGSDVFGLLQLGQAQSGSFVIGVQGGGNYSLYLFGAGQGVIASITYDTFGVLDASGVAGPAFTSAALFTTAVPEPTPAALLAAGLAVLGFVGRRRAFQAH